MLRSKIPADLPDPALILGWSVLVGFFVYLSAVTLRLTLDDWSSFEILYNSSTIANGTSGDLGAHSVLQAMLLSVVFLLGKAVIGPEFKDFGYQAAHLSIALFHAGFVYALYRLLRTRADKLTSLYVSVWAAFNPTLILLSASVTARLPALFFLTGAFYFRSRYEERGKRGNAIGFVACASLASASDHRLAVLIPVAVLAFDVALRAVHAFTTQDRVLRAAEPDQSQQEQGSRLGGLTGIFLPTLILFVMGVFYRMVFCGQDSGAGLISFHRSLLDSLVGSIGAADPLVNAMLFVRVFSLAGTLLFVAGACFRWKEDRRDAFWHLMWSAIFLVCQGFFFGANQSDLLLPLAPSFYYLAARGVDAVRSAARRISVRRAVYPLALLLSLWCVTQAIQGLRRFQDPVYSGAMLQKICRQLKVDSAPAVLWLGRPYWVYPADLGLHPKDGFAAAYRIFWPSVRFYANRNLEASGFFYIPRRRLNDPGFSLPPIPGAQKDGAVFIAHLDADPPLAELSVKRPFATLWFGRLRVLEFAPGSSLGTWTSLAAPSASMEVTPLSDGMSDVRFSGLPDGEYQVFTQSGPAIERVGGIRLPTSSGTLQFNARLPDPASGPRLRLVAFGELAEALPNGEIRRHI